MLPADWGKTLLAGVTSSVLTAGIILSFASDAPVNLTQEAASPGPTMTVVDETARAELASLRRSIRSQKDTGTTQHENPAREPVIDSEDDASPWPAGMSPEEAEEEAELVPLRQRDALDERFTETFDSGTRNPELLAQLSGELGSVALPEGAHILSQECSGSICLAEMQFPDRESALQTLDSVVMTVNSGCRVHATAPEDQLGANGQLVKVFLTACDS